MNSRFFIKRIMDFSVSLIALILLSPILLIIAIAVKMETSGPAIFRQPRIGKDTKIFHIMKFRSMRIDTPKETPTHLLDNADGYITNVGRILRKTSLDELPQLINVLKGEMSLVGPRPALWNQADLIAKRESTIGKYGLNANQIRPGITGWAQINGRDELNVDEKVRFDSYYMQKMDLLFDIKCIVLTCIKVVKREGIVEGRKID